MNEKLFEIQNLKKHFSDRDLFGRKKHVVRAVDGVTFDIYRGETFGLVGESGCGKSTLGRTLVGMYEPTGGKILYRGQDMTNPTKEQKEMRANEVQIIFQDPFTSLNPYWSVEQILSEPLRREKMEKKEMRDRILYLLDRVGLKEEDLFRYPHEFSGGQRQRIGIARALCVQPEFIVCDEPIAALDVSIQAQVVNMLEDIQDEFQLTYLFAAHDLSMVRYISDRIGVMYLGSLVELGTSDDLYNHPKHPYTKALLSAVLIADPKIARGLQRIPLKGEIQGAMDDFEGCPFASRCIYKKERCTQEKPVFREIEKDHYIACHFAEEIN